FGFLWRFSVGGGPSAPVGPAEPPLGGFVNLLNTTSTEQFPLSNADHEKFRVYADPFGPIFGEKSISNELNAFRNQLCHPPPPPPHRPPSLPPPPPPRPPRPPPPSPPPPPPPPPPRPPPPPPSPPPPPGPPPPPSPPGPPPPPSPPSPPGPPSPPAGPPPPIDDPVLHRQLARLLGTEYAARPDLIADAVLCGLGQQQGFAGGITFAPMGPRWCAWASPRQ